MNEPQPRRSASLRAWYGNWEERLTERLRERGFDSATEYVATAPTRSLIEMAQALSADPSVSFGDHDFAAEQVSRRLLDEAKATGSLERCARGLLVRSLNQHLPEGWHADWGTDIRGDGTTPIARRSHALATGWWTPISLHLPVYDATLRRVALAVRDASMPEGWLPASSEDLLLVELFQRFWQEPE